MPDPDTLLIWFLLGSPTLLIVWIVAANRHVFNRRQPAASVLRCAATAESRSSLHAIQHMRGVAALATKLSTRGSVLDTWMTDWAGFGCWSLALRLPPADAGRTHTESVVKAFWDGMSRTLSFDIEPVSAVSTLYGKHRIHEVVVDRETDPIGIAEEYLAKLLQPIVVESCHDADDAIRIARRLHAFAERLAARNVVIASLACECIADGSWSLNLYNGEKTDQSKFPDYFAVRVTWSGAARCLTISVSPLRPGLSPHEFKTELEQTMSSLDDAITFAENYLCNEVRTAA